ncbi:MAG: hypothetical protein ACAI43_26900 [Phycisphaerae bacterium]
MTLSDPIPATGRPPLVRALPWLVAGVTLVVFARVLSLPFSPIDDGATVGNPRLHPPAGTPPRWDSAGVLWFWAHPDLSLYIPVTYTVWGATASATWSDKPAAGWHVEPAAFHALNLAFHALAAAAVYSILVRLLRAARPDDAGDDPPTVHWPAAAAALLYALHPLQVESVAWVSGLKDVLAGSLSLCAFALYLRATAHPRLHLPPYLAATLLYALATLSKPSAITLPAVAFVIDALLLRRPSRGVVLRLLPWAVMAVPVVVVARAAQAGLSVPETPLPHRPVVAGASLSFYLWKLVLPTGLSFDHGWRPTVMLRLGWFWAVALVPVALAALLLAFRRRPAARVLGAAGLVLALSLAPVLGFVPFLYQHFSTVAEHYMHAAMLGPAIAAAWLLARASARAPHRRGPLAVGAAALLVVLAALSFFELRHWTTAERFLRRVVAVTPDSVIGNDALGTHLGATGRPAEAEAAFKAAIDADPTFVTGRVNLVQFYDRQGRVDDQVRAMHDLRKANDAHRPEVRLKLDGLFTQAGRAALDAGRPTRAVRFFEEALKLAPDDPAATAGLREAREWNSRGPAPAPRP